MFGGNGVEADAAVGSRDLLPSPPGQLAAGGHCPANGLGHGVEGHLEDVVQDEDDPLGRAEPLQHDQQGEPDAVIEGDPVGGVAEPVPGSGRDELDLAGVVGAFPAGAADLT